MLNEKANLDGRIRERDSHLKGRKICRSVAGDWAPDGRGEMQQIGSEQPQGRDQGSVFAA